MTETWHIVWWTRLTLPPCDSQAHWPELVAHYGAVPSSVALLSHPLPICYAPAPQLATYLSSEEQAVLPELVRRLTQNDGDRIAGGHAVLAVTVLATQVHLLAHCP